MLKDLKFLIVDDDAHTVLGLKASLRKLGAEHVKIATSGEAALRHLQDAKQRFDCLITDVCMPMGNGLELLHHVRTSKVGKTIRPDMSVILMSGMASQSMAVTARVLDVSAFLVKPFGLVALHQAIATCRKRGFSLNPRAYELVTPDALQVA